MRGEHVLNLLQEVEWVVGSLVANAAGELLLYQMPSEFGEEELKRTTVRLASIERCAELCELGVEQCDFSFNRYQLSMRRFRGGFLCVIVEAPVNRRALEMAICLALERLPGLVDARMTGALDSPDGNETTARARVAVDRTGEPKNARNLAPDARARSKPLTNADREEMLRR